MDCPFCKIVAGELPAHLVYEDAAYLAFLDIHPQSPGHVQVVPKTHYRWVWDVDDVAGYFGVVRKIARALQHTFGTEEVHMKVMGEEVPHAHVWVFPAPGKGKGDARDFVANARALRAALAVAQ